MTAAVIAVVVVCVLLVVFIAARRTAKTAFDSDAQKISERIKQNAKTKRKQIDEESAKKIKDVSRLSGDDLRRRAIFQLVRGGRSDDKTGK